MRLFSILTAIAVTLIVLLWVFERDRLFQFAGVGSDTTEGTEVAANESQDNTANATAETQGAVAQTETGVAPVSVVATRLAAQTVQDGVIVRGRTEAARQVDVKAETSGLITSEPLRKGTFVTAGQLLCEIEPGTRQASLAEAQAGLAEAQARLPEARARVSEAEARFAEAKINDTAAQQLSQDGYASETRVASTEAALMAAMATTEAAESQVQAAEASVQSAEAAVANIQKDIDRLRIMAPFEGLLETDTAELGSLMQPGSH
ncbi:MAG: efflux RND transporter periplasmic adaptor subunit, partial [Pseudomonadota bacterium]